MISKTRLLKQLQKLILALGTAEDRRLAALANELVEVEKKLIDYQKPNKKEDLLNRFSFFWSFLKIKLKYTVNTLYLTKSASVYR